MPSRACAQHGLVHVGRVDPAAVVEAGLLEQDRHRVDFLAGRAARVPDPDERVRPQDRDHLVAERAVEGRVAEHGADVDRERRQQPLQPGRIVEHPLLQIRRSSGGPRPASRRAAAAAATRTHSRGSRSRSGGRRLQAALRSRRLRGSSGRDVTAGHALPPPPLLHELGPLRPAGHPVLRTFPRLRGLPTSGEGRRLPLPEGDAGVRAESKAGTSRPSLPVQPDAQQREQAAPRRPAW